MVDWADARAMLEEKVADTFDVTVLQLVAYRTGLSVNHPPAVDEDRPAFEFRGTIDLQPPADRISRHMPSDTAVRNESVSYAAVLTAHNGAWPWIPRNGDRVVRLSDGKAWIVGASEKDGSSRPAWYLVEVKHVVS